MVLAILTLFTYICNSTTVSYSWRYDELCRNRLKQHCQMVVTIPQPIPKGSILFLQLNGFRQADRRYSSLTQDDSLVVQRTSHGG